MRLRAGWAVLLAAACMILPGCGFRRNPVETPIVTNSKQPDKELFDRAMADLEHAKYTVSRLTLQTLMNTYPDSEYMAKAKLGVADSWYRQGGTSDLLQAETEYKDFITFFPTMPEAAEAQMRVAMIHYREMEKANRDSTQARRAEQEFQRLLLNFPDSQFAPQAVQRLREVQEILAQGAFEVARFYFLQAADRATQPRLKELIQRYPNFSEADSALFLLGRSLERSDKKNAAEAASYYARIVRDYPLSDRVKDAKEHLAQLNSPAPDPDPVAVARMTYEISHRETPKLREKLTGNFHRAPSVASAQGKIGLPTMTALGAAQPEAPPPGLIPESRNGPAGNTLMMENVPDPAPAAK
jgi:outer membrane protein assembly factor BamD